MADLTVTPANVTAGDNAVTKTSPAGEAIVAGKTVYVDPTTKKLMLCDSNSATPAAHRCDGVALNGAALNQPCTFIKSGDFNPGATVVVGTVYAVSETAGGIAPVADLAAGEYVVVLGVATAANKIALDIDNSGVAVPA